MTEIESRWRHKSDGQLLEAIAHLEEARTVSRRYRAFVALVFAQWFAFFVIVFVIGSGSMLMAVAGTLCALVFVITCIAVPITEYRLMKSLAVESPGAIAFLGYLPAFSLFALAAMRMFGRQWGAERGVEMGFFGPTDAALTALRDRATAS